MLTRSTKPPATRRPLQEGNDETLCLVAKLGLISSPLRQAAVNHTDAEIVTHSRRAFNSRLPKLTDFILNSSPLVPLSKHPAWLNIFQSALGHEPLAIEASSAGRTVGFLPLALIDSLLFGRFLVSLPYLNTNGVVAANTNVAIALASRAVALAEELNVRHLELRHENALDIRGLDAQIRSKVHMRLPLSPTADLLWKRFDPKVRNQIRKGEKNSFRIVWGGVELLEPFYEVITRNMRDLGSPMYGVNLFQEILTTFPAEAEICLVSHENQPVATALLLHGRGVTEVPTASSLKEYNPTSVNMLMYWHLLCRATERGQQVFDFGRCTPEGNTFKFKKQWGAEAVPAVWQYSLNRGEVGEMRPDHPRYRLAIRLWQLLPLSLTRVLGPQIIRGIP